jgi:hypothetical protein
MLGGIMAARLRGGRPGFGARAGVCAALFLLSATPLPASGGARGR